MRCLPRRLAWLLAALLLVQGVAAATACVGRMGGETVEVCGAEGKRLLRLDAEGRPVEEAASGFCAACGALPAVPPPPGPRLAGPVLRGEALPAALREVAGRPASRPPYVTRGPPTG